MAEVGDPNPPEGTTSDDKVADPSNVQLEETVVQPVDVQPVDVQPVDVQPVDVQAVDVQAVDVQPVAAPEDDVQVADARGARGDMPLVLITGATGFIGMHILNELLMAGEYLVRAVVRDSNGEKQVAAVNPNARYPVEIVRGNIWGSGGFAGLLDDCSYIIHVTNPTLALLNRKLPEEEIIKKSGDVRYTKMRLLYDDSIDVRLLALLS